MSKNNLFSRAWAIGNPLARGTNVEDQNLIRKPILRKVRKEALTKEGPTHEVKKDHEGLRSQKEGKRKK